MEALQNYKSHGRARMKLSYDLMICSTELEAKVAHLDRLALQRAQSLGGET